MSRIARVIAGVGLRESHLGRIELSAPNDPDIGRSERTLRKIAWLPVERLR